MQEKRCNTGSDRGQNSLEPFRSKCSWSLLTCILHHTHPCPASPLLPSFPFFASAARLHMQQESCQPYPALQRSHAARGTGAASGSQPKPQAPEGGGLPFFLSTLPYPLTERLPECSSRCSRQSFVVSAKLSNNANPFTCGEFGQTWGTGGTAGKARMQLQLPQMCDTSFKIKERMGWRWPSRSSEGVQGLILTNTVSGSCRTPVAALPCSQVSTCRPLAMQQRALSIQAEL